MAGTEANDNSESKMLTESQRQRMQRNREKAMQLRKARIANLTDAEKTVNKKLVNSIARPRDTGAGFFVEDDDEDANLDLRPVVSQPAPLFAGDRPLCLECNEEFSDSYLQKYFEHNVCDSCRDNDGEHCLISRTDAKNEYLLKDCDFDKREPPLKFILKKNPHNKHGNMKLYLRLQVEKRALEIFGDEETIEQMKEEREENQLKRKKKAFDKKVKALRMEVRSSLYRKNDDSHTHTYGEEVYNEESDTYTKTCTTCNHEIEFEKM